MELELNLKEKLAQYMFEYFENILSDKYYPEKEHLVCNKCVVGILNMQFDEMEPGTFVKCCLDLESDDYIYVYWTNDHDKNKDIKTEDLFFKCNSILKTKRIEGIFVSSLLKLKIENL